MSVTFLIAGQWQGSGSARALRLVDGAAAIADDLPRGSTLSVEVPLEAGDAEGSGIPRFSSIRLLRQRIAQALEGVDGPVVTIGGGCGVDYAPIARAAAQGPFALLWLDAHGDANTAESSPSGSYDGMVLRSLIADGVVAGDRVVHGGGRSWDDGEREGLAADGVRLLGPEALADPAALRAAVAATGAETVYVHVDLDVLDPADFGAVGAAEPWGVPLEQVLAGIRGLWTDLTLAGAALTGFSPDGDDAIVDDMPAVLRLVGALREGAA